MRFLYFIIVFSNIVISSIGAMANRITSLNKVIIYPNPAAEMRSTAYRVMVAGKVAPVYMAKVGAADDQRRFKAVDDLMHSDEYFDVAAFTYFDLQGEAMVRVNIEQKIKTVKILPSSAGIKADIVNNTVIFKVSRPQNLTIEINGEWVKSLHLFVNPVEVNKPKPNDPNVIFFGPGVHNITNLIIGDNKTIYVAGGAVVKVGIGIQEKFGVEPSGLKNYSPRLILSGKNIRLCGHGIIDASACPTHSANFIYVHGNNITVEGVVFLNSPGWTVPLRETNNALINNIKIIGYRANSDGIDICNSTNATVKNCFVRTNDDLIVIKTWENAGASNHIIVKNCVLWNQLANALSLGAELRENVSDVLFANCDIIHDQGREWSMHVFQTDGTTINNIRFKNINIEESKNLISLWIGKIPTSYNGNNGNISHISFKNIRAKGYKPIIQLDGNSIVNKIKDITFTNVCFNGKPITRLDIHNNPFVDMVTIN